MTKLIPSLFRPFTVRFFARRVGKTVWVPPPPDSLPISEEFRQHDTDAGCELSSEIRPGFPSLTTPIGKFGPYGYKLTAAEVHYVENILPKAMEHEEMLRVAEKHEKKSRNALLGMEIPHEMSNETPLLTSDTLATYSDRDGMPSIKDRIQAVQKILSLGLSSESESRAWSQRRLDEIFIMPRPTGLGCLQSLIARLSHRIRTNERHLRLYRRDTMIKRRLFILRARRHRLFRLLRKNYFEEYHRLQKRINVVHDLFNHSKMDDDFRLMRRKRYLEMEAKRKKKAYIKMKH